MSACRPERATSCCSRAGYATKCRRRAMPASASRLASTTAGRPPPRPRPAGGVDECPHARPRFRRLSRPCADRAARLGRLPARSWPRRRLGGVLPALYDRLPPRSVAHRDRRAFRVGPQCLHKGGDAAELVGVDAQLSDEARAPPSTSRSCPARTAATAPRACCCRRPAAGKLPSMCGRVRRVSG